MRACTAHPLAFEWTGAFRYVREHVRATRIDVEFIAAPDNYCFDKYEVRVFCICPSGNTCTFRCVYARQRPCKRPLLSKRRRCVRSSTATQRCASADGRLQMFPLENITSRYALHIHTHTHTHTLIHSQYAPYERAGVDAHCVCPRLNGGKWHGVHDHKQPCMCHETIWPNVIMPGWCLTHV
jgi:hypothetical protein